MEFGKKTLVIALVVVLLLCVMAIGLMRIEDNFKAKVDKVPENNIEISTDTPKNYFNKKIYSKMDIYNELVNAVDDFLYLLRERDFANAYAKMNPDYLYYKGIKNLDEFKNYIYVHGYDNASFNIIGYSKADFFSDDQVYVCKVVTFTANVGDEYETPTEYMMNKKENHDTFVVSLYEDDYRISFEGLISKENFLNPEREENSLIAFTPVSKYCFDNMTVYEVTFENLSDMEINPSDIIHSIVAEDSSSDFYWADSLPNTKEYELYPGESKNYFITIKHGDYPLESVTINFNEDLKISKIYL